MNNELNSVQAGKIWEKQSEKWTILARAGYDIFRDYVNTPGFFSTLPHVKGLRCLDVGCGEGHNTRLLAKKGAKVIGLDISPNFIKHARNTEKVEKLGIQYTVGNGTKLPYGEAEFDFVASFSTMMDIPELDQVIAEVWRILKPGGFFQFSITHPCFWAHKMNWVTDEKGAITNLICKNYFDQAKCLINEWTFGGIDEKNADISQKFRTPIFNRTLAEWINCLTDKNFHIETLFEPRPKIEDVKKMPTLKLATLAAFFLIIRCRKLV